MIIRWVNHASFVVEHEDVNLICDPWLFGPAFGDGWDLLSKSVFEATDFSKITHIWYSHEHPDHFVPRVLTAIAEDVRKRITVVYQQTRDGKVIKYCKSLGFQTLELPQHQPTRLGKDVTVTCGAVPFYDSWLLIEAGGKRLFNLNDCVVDDEAVARRLQHVVGKVDVLLTQFNWAEWMGNPDRRDIRERCATEKRRRMKLQTGVFRPTYTVPFASYFYFSHEENFYLNDGMNQVDDVARFIASECNSQPVVLYPGDTWAPGDAHDFQRASDRYRQDMASIRPVHRAGESVPLEGLVRMAESYRKRIAKKNNPFFLRLASQPWLGVLPALRIFVDDLDLAVEFDWRTGLRKVEIDRASVDISMHSESLAFVLRFDWGMDTLTVNGRFRASDEGYRRFMKTFAPGALNNIGRRFDLGLVFDVTLLKRILSKRKSKVAARKAASQAASASTSGEQSR